MLRTLDMGYNLPAKKCLLCLVSHIFFIPLEMNRFRIILSIPLLAANALASPENGTPFENTPLPVLEKRLVDLDKELEQLPTYSLRGGLGSIGHRSKEHEDPNNTEWVQIELGETTSIDQVVLAPNLWRDSNRGFVVDGFPSEFQIIAGLGDHENGTVLASYRKDDRPWPRIAPVVFSFPPIAADWVRIEATKLSDVGFDGRYVLQLAEAFIFSGEENVALQKKVSVSSESGFDRLSRGKHTIVDGFIPYLMDAAEGDASVAFFSRFEEEHTAVITIDLGSIEPLNGLHLHSADQNDSVPLNYPGDFGIPEHLILEGSNEADFSDRVRLLEYRHETIYDAGPIIMLAFPEKRCRYVRLVAEASGTDPLRIDLDDQTTQIGFAEIEILSKGRNLALGKPIQTNLRPDAPHREIEALTDGRNFYGPIIPLREWLNKLARRHDLETDRPLLVAALNEGYARQKANLNRTYWLVALLGGVIVAIILIDRIFRLRQVASIKERLAADLHDELGADLHSIGLLSDLAEESKHSPAELAMLHKRIRNLTMQSGDAVRHCTDMLETTESNVSIKDSIYQASRRIMAKLENRILIEGEEYLDKLKPKTRFDLCLFYNECLVNISKHSGASKFITQLIADKNCVILAVSDNGRGLSDSHANGVPKSLKRRARLLGAKVSVEQPDSGGTRINLKLRTRNWGFRK